MYTEQTHIANWNGKRYNINCSIEFIKNLYDGKNLVKIYSVKFPSENEKHKAYKIAYPFHRIKKYNESVQCIECGDIYKVGDHRTMYLIVDDEAIDEREFIILCKNESCDGSCIDWMTPLDDR